MRTKILTIEQANEFQLRQFAMIMLSVEISPQASREKTISKIREAGWDKDDITVIITDDDPESQPIEAADDDDMPLPPEEVDEDLDPGLRFDTDSSNDPRVTIIVHEAAGPGGKRPVPVGVNGRVMLLPRGKEIVIPYRYYEALVEAKEVHIEETSDPKDPLNVEINRSEVASYSYHAVKLPTERQLEIWRRAKRATQRDQVRAKKGLSPLTAKKAAPAHQATA